MIRIAAAGDLHAGLDSRGRLAAHFEGLSREADVFLLAGDLTRCGSPREAEVLVGEMAGVDVPIVAVLGNHDYHADGQEEIRKILEKAGVVVLEGETTTVDTSGGTIGVAGLKGFCGGFQGACGSEFGDPR